jgi:3-hydroxyisobutyrate dehydrogenase
MRIAWIGLGVMGRSMAGHLLAAGHDLSVFTRTRSTADALVDRGATWCDSPAGAAAHADAVCTMVGYPSDLRSVVLGEAGEPGALAAMPDGGVFVDFTTSEPSLATEIAAAAAPRGIDALDAPVSGGDVGAQNATLSIMVGATQSGFERAKPILDVVGGTVVLQGPPGSGQHTKAVNQILVAGTMLGMTEALLYAKQSGLDPNTVLESVGGGAAASWTLANLAPRVLDGDFDPGFYVEHFVKDLGIALNGAEQLGLDLPMVELARRLYTDLAQDGGARNGTQALILEVARRNAVAWP